MRFYFWQTVFVIAILLPIGMSWHFYVYWLACLSVCLLLSTLSRHVCICDYSRLFIIVDGTAVLINVTEYYAPVSHSVINDCSVPFVAIQATLTSHYSCGNIWTEIISFVAWILYYKQFRNKSIALLRERDFCFINLTYNLSYIRLFAFQCLQICMNGR